MKTLNETLAKIKTINTTIDKVKTKPESIVDHGCSKMFPRSKGIGNNG